MEMTYRDEVVQATMSRCRVEGVRRPSCDCYACLRQFADLLNRCGCDRCYYEHRDTRQRTEYSQYQDRHIVEMRHYQMQMQSVRVEFKPDEKYLAKFIGEKEMNIVEKVKNLKLSAGDKLLRKHNVVDAEGNLTDTGQDLIWDKLLEAHKDEIVKDLKAVDAAEKAKCK